MFFDDRLATVLRQRATGEAGLRTQFRQLLDLLGKDRARRGNSPDHSMLAAAWLRMDALAEAIPAEERARIVREPGWRFRSPDLASHLADHEPEVASAALNRAELSSEDWQALIPRLPVRARGFLRNRRDLPVDVDALLARLGVHDRGLPAPAPFAGSARRVEERPAAIAPIPLRPVTPSPANTRDRDDSGRTEISALVERIAQFRRERGDNRQEFEHSPRLPLGEMPERLNALATSFGFAADAGGRIEWASADVAPMVVGTRLFAAQRLGDEDATDVGLERAFTLRQPITGGAVSLAGAPAIAGDWRIDAQPRFSEDGHFTGYFGRLRRVRSDSDTSLAAEAREADRIRQLLHELRTPVTAVQGYAEVIQQQLFGPAPHEYRALAAAIAADAARILAGFEELDRLARLETGAMRVEPGESDLAGLLRRTIEQIMPVLAPRGSALRFESAPDAALLIAIDLEDAEALVWRVLASIAAACGPEEQLSITLAPLIGAKGALARMTATLPAALAAEGNLFAATARTAGSAVTPGLFGAGFALRLARAEARGAGGELVRDGDTLVLTLPLLTGEPGLHSLDTEGHPFAGT
ncbi:MAG: sensor histidine kinase [Erythrobacter sp.]|nr:sensor histidine kinase [Erythrobacter sp.]